MKNFAQYIGITSPGMLGRCGFCMRAALASASIAWLVSVTILIATRHEVIALVGMLAALALTALWIAHLAAYATRRTRCTLDTPTIDASGNITRHSRRELFPLFAKAFAFAALMTAMPAIFQAARAQDDGGCPPGTPTPCGAQYCCSGPAIWFCQGYTGTVPNWRQMGTFCTNVTSDEDVADLRSNCAVLVQC